MFSLVLGGAKDWPGCSRPLRTIQTSVAPGLLASTNGIPAVPSLFFLTPPSGWWLRAIQHRLRRSARPVVAEIDAGSAEHPPGGGGGAE